MRILVMGDVHGALKAMKQALERANFDPEKDRLIFLGDVCDGWPETKQCMDYFMSLPNLVHIMGNHDMWTLKWLEEGYMESFHRGQGGHATEKSFGELTSLDAMKYATWLRKAAYFYYDRESNRLFVHGGFNRAYPLEAGNDVHRFFWDRTLVNEAVKVWVGEGKPLHPESRLTGYKEVYIGHTSLTYLGIKPLVPTQMCEIWNMDTGGGFEGYVSVMDIDTKEFWQSDKVPTLYPDHLGRNDFR